VTTCGFGALLSKGEKDRMESFIEQFRIRSLRGQIEASRLCSLSLTVQLEGARTDTEKVEIAWRQEKALKQTQIMELMLEVLEGQVRDGVKEADSVAL
jgi:hypothetical protein